MIFETWVALGPRTQGYYNNLTLTLSLKGRGIEVGADLRVCPDDLGEHIGSALQWMSSKIKTQLGGRGKFPILVL